MYCTNCGKAYSNEFEFCPYCGSKKYTNKRSHKELITMKCKHCNGEMVCDSDQEILICPYCGSKELIPLSDDVRIQKIKSKTEKEITDSITNAQILISADKTKRKAMDLESEKIQYEHEKIKTFKNSRWRFLLPILFVVSLLLTIFDFVAMGFLTGIAALGRTALFLLAWMNGLQVVKSKSKYLFIFITVLAFLMIIPVFMAFFKDLDAFAMAKDEEKYGVTYVWPSQGLDQLLPEPSIQNGKIDFDNEDEFQITLYRVDPSYFDEYINKCKEYGFTSYANRTSNSFWAYNDQQYKIDIDYWDYDNSMNITVRKPHEISDIAFPDNDLLNSIPIPPSSTGYISTDRNDYFNVHLAMVDKTMFDEYKEACIRAGFTVDPYSTEETYHAKNKHGYYVYIHVEPFDYMDLLIKKEE